MHLRPLPAANSTRRTSFRSGNRLARTNWAGLVVKARNPDGSILARIRSLFKPVLYHFSTVLRLAQTLNEPLEGTINGARVPCNLKPSASLYSTPQSPHLL